MILNTKNSLHASDFKGKVAFFDVDGVLAPLRFNGHTRHYDPPMCVNSKELEAGAFIHRLPCRHLQDIVNSIDTKRNVIVTGYVTQRDGIFSEKERTDKEIWITHHYPKIQDVVYVKYGEQKAPYILEYCKKHNINLEDTIFIDDEIHYLAETEHVGIPSWHVSCLMDFYKEEVVYEQTSN